MTGPLDPDATRSFGDSTMPARPRPSGTTGADHMVVGPPNEPPSGPGDDGGDDDERRSWWWVAAAALVLGVVVGVVVALLASGGDDAAPDATTTSSSSTTITAATTPTTNAPTTTTTTAPAPPGQVLNLTASAGGGSGEVSLHWDSVSGATQYRIYRSGTSGDAGSLIETTDQTSHVDTPGTHAYYEVSAVSSSGAEGDRSVQVCGAPVGDSC